MPLKMKKKKKKKKQKLLLKSICNWFYEYQQSLESKTDITFESGLKDINDILKPIVFQEQSSGGTLQKSVPKNLVKFTLKYLCPSFFFHLCCMPTTLLNTFQKSIEVFSVK